MSKIQDALSKLQRSRPAAASAAPAVHTLAETVDRSVPLKKPADPGARRREHAYGGVALKVDHDALRAAGLLAPQSQARQVADEYRHIKRPILANASGRGQRPLERGNLVMVGSAVSGEGKTFTCINLCLSMATEKDWSVLLVDADVAKPHVSRLFGLGDAPGLLDVLRDHNIRAASVVSPTDVPGLSIMPAGGRDEFAAELLASERMEEICRQLAGEDRRRMIVFDSSPILQTTEAPILASHVGQMVMIVKADRTSRQQLQTAISKIDPELPISLVLNQAKSGGLLDMYIGGNYYGYGEYGREEAEAPRG